MKYGRILLGLMPLLATLSFISCTESDDLTSGKIVVIGSESVWRVMDDEAREFMAMYGKATVRAVKTGSVDGLKTLFETPIAKETLLAVSARPLTGVELAAAKKQGFDPKEYRIARDGIAIIVNSANPVAELTLEQVRDIFSGRLRNWGSVPQGEGRSGDTTPKRSVSGQVPSHDKFDRPIKVIFGQTNSATYQQMSDSVLKGVGLAPGTQNYQSMFDIIKAVASDKAAIGYCGSTYLYRDWLVKPRDPEPGIKAVALSRNAGSDALPPDQGTIYDSSYVLGRDIYLIARREPKGIVSGFITFVMSAKGQQIAVADGLAPATVTLTVKREAE
jgi:phosphate transport system substrate-binding protein